MGVIKDSAIILEALPLQRADCLVVFFSKNSGMIHGIAEGARRVKSRFAGCFEHLNYVLISYYKKENEELVKINECEIISSIMERGLEEEGYYAVFYLSELAKEFGTAGRNTKFFNILESFHKALVSGMDIGLIVRWGELQVLNEHGSLSLAEVCATCKTLLSGKKYISANGAMQCTNCRGKSDLELSEEIFMLMNKLLYAKINDLNKVRIEGAKLKRVGMITRYLIEHCIEKPLQFYRFYNQIKRDRS